MSSILPRIITIVGTNASGKSSLGIELARAFGGEIISADSRQVYKGFDLCCGKVTAEEREMAPHHLLDVREIGEPFSVSNFQQMAYHAADDIIARGKTPLIVGGTGLYVNSVVYGYVMQDEEADIELRYKLEGFPIEKLQSMLTGEGRAFLELNPSDWKNKRRIIRIIEKTTRGEPLEYTNSKRYEALQLGTLWSKEAIHSRIDERLETRLAQGMIDEVKTYLENGGNPKYLYDLGLEYRYILRFLTGEFQSMDEFKLELGRAIKRLAKKQVTWFKRDNTINWLDMTADYLQQAEALVADFLSK